MRTTSPRAAPAGRAAAVPAGRAAASLAARLFVACLPAAGLLAAAGTPCGAVPLDTHYQFVNVSESPTSSIAPAIAHTVHSVTGEDVLMVAWLEDGVGVFTRAIVDGQPGPTVEHGLGAEPELDGAAGEFALAYTANDAIVVRRWNAAGWAAPDTVRSGVGVGTATPDITIDTHAAPTPEVLLVWSDLTTVMEADVWFSRTVLGVWQSAEQVNASIPGYTPTPSPQVQPTFSVEGWVPRVYWLANDFDLRYRARLTGGWTIAEGIDGYFGTRMEIASGPDGRHHLVSNGPQPTCPCNIIVYCCEVEGDWGPIEQLTVDVGYYDLPSFPNAAVGSDGRAQAFWHQSARDEQMQWFQDDLFYKRRAAYHVWIDDTHLLDGHVGGQPDFCLDDDDIPAFVSVEEIGNREVMAAIYVAGTAVDGDEVAAARPRPLVRAAPNPFSASIGFRLEGDLDRTTSLAIVDVAGRRVTELPVGPRGVGGSTIRWDGRADDGRRCAAGVYWWSLEREDGGNERGRIVLVR